MNATSEQTALLQGVQIYDEIHAAVDARTLEILDRRRRMAAGRRRGWLVRRMLLLADLVGLATAFVFAQWLIDPHASFRGVDARSEFVIFALSLPGWILVTKLYGLYDRDEERTDHSTADEVMGVFHMVTVCVWVFYAFAYVTNVAHPEPPKLLVFWLTAVAFVSIGRASARAYCRRRINYLQNTIIVGAGEVGQLIGRKVLTHPEYGINLVGFVDAEPKERREDLDHLTVLGSLEKLPALVRGFDIERVIVAFSNEGHREMLEVIRSLKDLAVQIDIVPRLFELVGPGVGVHTVEGLPLLGLPSARISRSSMFIKRMADIAIASFALTVSAPLFLVVAILIKRNSPGPVFFRQTRLGMNMREFTALKFRTMKVGTTDEAHREYIARTTNGTVRPSGNGLFKLDRRDVITSTGAWLRRTSLDEVPQLINVLRGEMSVVGPRPCIPYETERFEPHHFERFLVPAGLTGLWQVTARGHATFAEALEMDVRYARHWSIGLDVWCLLRTPFQLFNGANGTA